MSVRNRGGRRFDAKDTNWADAKPNNGHAAVAKLVAEGKATAIITQNVDNLHQDSGVPDTQVIELHGNTRYAKCLSCETRYELGDLKMQFESLGRVEPCSRCGGIVKTATISFGQSMPEQAMADAQTATNECDLFIVIGSSLVVYPAAGFPEYAKRRGAGLVIVQPRADAARCDCGLGLACRNRPDDELRSGGELTMTMTRLIMCMAAILLASDHSFGGRRIRPRTGYHGNRRAGRCVGDVLRRYGVRDSRDRLRQAPV